MCFCFDGENALRAYRPADCRDRLPTANACAPGLIAFFAEPDERDADGSFKLGDARGIPRLAVGLERMY